MKYSLGGLIFCLLAGVAYCQPTIGSINPTSTPAGDANLTITINGTRFANGSTASWTAGSTTTVLTTTFVSSSQLLASVPQSLVNSPTNATINVTTAGFAPSNAVNFTVLGPTITGLLPNSGTAGATNIALTVTGANFISNPRAGQTSVISFNSNALTTTFVSGTSLTAILPTLPATAGPYPVQVTNPGGATSNNATFTVLPQPSVTSTSPTAWTTGNGSIALIVNGANFINGDSIAWDTSKLTTTFVNANRLTATVPSGLVTGPATHQISVFSPDSVQSNSVGFLVNGVPSISSLNPNTVTATAPGFTLTVTGANFTNTMAVRWNGQSLSTTFVATNQLTAPITAAMIASPGVAQVSVLTADGVPSGNSQFVINPAPTLTAVSPSVITATHASLTLTLDGANFVNGMTAMWNSSPRSTTFISSTRLTASIPPSDVASAGGANAFIAVGDGATTALRPVTIVPKPGVKGTTPNSAAAGGPAFTIFVNGNDFLNGTTVLWNGQARTTTFIDASNLSAAIPATDIAAAGKANVGVVSFDGVLSNTSPFDITTPMTITSVSPLSRTAGSTGVTLTVNGANFSAGTVGAFNGSERGTTLINSTQILISLSDNDLITPGTFPISAFDNAGTSNSLPFTVNPVPSITSLNPSSRTATGPQFTLTISGSGFVNGMQVQWNGSTVPTSFVTGSQLSATIAAGLIANAGSANVTVLTSDGISSNISPFTINPRPAISSLAPAQTTAGAAPFTLTVNGSNFVNGMTVQWNGANRPTTFVNSTLLTAAIPFGDVASVGTPNITVLSSDGAASLPSSFTINPAPSLTAMNPVSRTAAAGSFTLTINGANLTGSTVNWNNVARPTTVINSGQVTAAIPGTDVQSVGIANVTVVNPDSVRSNALTFTINSVPSISGLTPTSATAGAAGFTLTINGGGFTNNMTAQWNGSPLTTTFVNSTQLTAPITPAMIATAGPASVTVLTADGVTSNASTFTINPAGALTSLNPQSVTAGHAAFTLTVNGSNFSPGSTVQWNGSARTTTFVSASQLTATVLTSDVVSSDAGVTVTVLSSAGPVSNGLTFTIIAAPTITTLTPASHTAGTSAFTLTVDGANFVSGMTVQWNGSARTTTFASATQLTAAISAGDVVSTGAANVTVLSLDGVASNSVGFTINSTPTITSLIPSTRTATAPGFTLTVNGTNLVNNMKVQWNGSQRTTTYVSASQLTATIPQSDIATSGNASVTVITVDNVTSAASTFTIAAAPAITTLSPSAFTAGHTGFTLTVNGTGFVNGMTVQWGGASRVTTFVSSTRLTAAITAADIASAGASGPGSVNVTVVSVDGAVSPASTFTINSPPAISSLNPSSHTSGSLGFTLTVNGSNFVNGVTVQWNGSTRATTFVNSGQLTAAIPNTDVSSATTVNVTVLSLDGVPSSAAQFAVGGQPTITSLNPAARTVTSGAFTLTVNGASFDNAMTVRWNNQAQTTTYVSATQLNASIPGSLVAATGTASITVLTGDGISSSPPVSFTINPIPSISALTPTTLTAGHAGFTLTVTGANFTNGSQVQWNGATRTTTFQSGNTLTATITAQDVANAGPITVTVVTPDGVVSPAATFTVSPGPTLTSISPSSRTAGATAFTLICNGVNFVAGMQVNWNGSPRPTTFVNSGQLTAAIPGNDVAAQGSAVVTIVTSDGVASKPATFSIGTTPFISSLSPNTATAGAPPLTLTINGANFDGSSTARWNGQAQPTTFVSSSQLAINVGATMLAAPAIAGVSVATPDGVVSNTSAFTIVARPIVSGLSLNSGTAGRAGFTLTVTGANFVNGTTVQWDGQPRGTTYVSATQLTAVISANDVSFPGNIAVSVVSPDNSASNALTFTVTPPPTVSTTSPFIHTEGFGSFTLTVTGTNFNGGYVVLWNGQTRATTFVSSTTLTAAIPATDVVSAGTPVVSVQSADGVPSNVVPFVINPAPSITSLSPAFVTATAPAFTLTVNGANFKFGYKVRWDNTLLTTTIDSTETVTALVPANLIPVAGSAVVAVVTSDGIPTTPPVTFVISPAPTITNLNPGAVTTGRGAFTLTVNGSAFFDGTVGSWNGQPRNTTILSPNQLTMDILAPDVANTGTASVYVTTQDGVNSNNKSIAISTAQTISNLSPASRTAGSTGFTLTINGANFTNNMGVQWNGNNRTTTFVSAQQLTATIPATDLTTATNAAVTVLASDGTSSNAATFIVNAAPLITSLSPASRTATTGPFTLTVNGSNYIAGMTVNWNGQALNTTFINSSQLTADVTALLVASPGSASITVMTADGATSPPSVLSAPVQFTVTPAPAISSVNPTIVTAGHAAFTLTINGSNFANGMGVYWNGSARNTTFVNAGQLTADIPSTDVPSAGSAAVTVRTSDGAISQSATVQIVAAPSLTSITPVSRTAGATQFTLSLTGANFTASSTVQWNGQSRSTAFSSSTALTGAILTSDVSQAGSANVTVLSSDGVQSNAQSFTINLAPSVTSLSPASITAGAAAFTLTVHGAGFVNNSTVAWNGQSLTTTFVSASVLTAAVPASNVSAAGSVNVTVVAADGVTSSASLFIILAGPAITSVSPNTSVAGQPAFTLTINGTNFDGSMTVQWNGAARNTTFVSGNILTAAIPATDIATAASANVTVVTGDGVTSAPAVFTVGNAPSITSLSPSTRTATSAALTLTITGANFDRSSASQWAGSPRTTTFVSATQLTAAIPATDLAQAGPFVVTVLNASNVASNSATFTVAPIPTITSLSPVSRTAGSGAQTLTINGANFSAGSSASWNGTGLTSILVSGTQMTAAVPASLLTAAGSASVTVTTADGVSSTASPFTILPAPSLTSMSPSSITAGQPGFTITVTGANFVNGAAVLWNGAAIATTFVSGTSLTAVVPQPLIATAGQATVRVQSADGVNSPTLTFTINPGISITLPSTSSVQANAAYSLVPTVTGGVAPLTFSAVGLPSGLSINSSNGTITGSVSTAGSYAITVTVTDANHQTATAGVTLTVGSPPITITTNSPLPNGTVDSAYSQSFSATGGTGTYTFTLTGSAPPGLGFGGATLSGTPTTQGTFNFGITATDTNGVTGSKAFSLTVNAAALTLTGSVSDGQVGQALSATFGATGGLPPYTFSGGGGLPPGTSFSGKTLSGTPTDAGTFPFSVSVTDSLNTTTSRNFTIVIAPNELTLVSATLDDARAGVAYSATFRATGGVPPYTFSGGGAGLTVGSGGTLSGTPDTPGQFTIDVSVTDSKGTRKSASFGLTVLIGAPVVSTTSLGDGIVGLAYSGAVAASGGTPPYTFAVAGLPSGLSASASGAISGTPSAAGTFSISITVTDSKEQTGAKSLVLNITGSPITIAPASLSNGTVGTPYSASFIASGGAAPYTFTATGLPAGFAVSSAGALTGTAASPGTIDFTVTAKDSQNATGSKAYSISFTLPSTPGLTFPGLPTNVNPAAQPRLQVGVATPYPVDVTATETMTFAADSGPDDPAVQFSSGGRVAHLTILAGATTAAADVGIQTGTVAGTITITSQLQAAGQDITPSPAPTRTIRVNATAPSISGGTATRNANGFTLQITGFSSGRDVTQAIFVFTLKNGTTSTITIQLDTLFASWFGSAASAQFGSMFMLTQPFTVQGDASSVVSVTVTLVSKAGTSSTFNITLP